MLHVILNQKLHKASFQLMYNMVVAFEVWMLNFPEVMLNTHLPRYRKGWLQLILIQTASVLIFQISYQKFGLSEYIRV